MTTSLRTTRAERNGAKILNDCEKWPCKSTLKVNEGSFEHGFDVTVYFSGLGGEMRGCEFRGMGKKGECFVFVFGLKLKEYSVVVVNAEAF